MNEATETIQTAVTLGTDEWLLARKKYITGTDAAKIMGLSPYATAIEVFKDKRSDEIQTIEDNDAMYFGRKLEKVVAETFAERMNKTVEPATDLVIHPTNPYMAASLDYYTTDDEGNKAVLECKTVSGYAYDHWETAIPVHYYIQVQHQLACAGLFKAYVAVLVDGRKFHVVPIDRDENMIKAIEERSQEFFEEYVQKNTPPPMTVADFEKITSTDSAVALEDAPMLDKWVNYMVKREKLQALEEEVKLLEDSIKEFIGESSSLTMYGKVVATWKTQTRTSLDTKKIQAELPDVYAKYTRESSSRVFRVVKKKSE